MSAPGGCLLQGVSAPGEVSAPRGSVSAPGGCLLQGDVCSRGVSAPGGVVCSWRVSAWGCLLTGCLLLGGVCSGGVVSQHALRQTLPPVNRMTDRCKNITLATTSLRPVTISYLLE